jgi:hypothetical protein
MPEARANVDLVRSEVKKLLAQSAAYKALPKAEQGRFEEHMVNVSSYLADPGWVQGLKGPEAQALEQAKPPPPVEQLKSRLAQKPGQVDFDARAMRQGVEEFGNLVQKVDFPKFVSGLVQGVFQAIVDASIQQMQAYGELLSATAKSVDQFVDDHISDAQARDHIANRYPSLVQVDTSGDGPATLKPREGADLAPLASQFGVGDDLSDEEQEQNLVNQAKLHMAQSKQQNLAMMVLLGINRIVVTDGKINAKVVFDISANDSAKRTAQAQLHDSESSSSMQAGTVGFFIGGAVSASAQDHKTTVGSAVDDTSESKAQMKAQLSGDVHINFKSETFPLEKMVDVMGMQTINEKAQPTPFPRGVPAAPAAPAVAAPAPASPPVTSGAHP